MNRMVNLHNPALLLVDMQAGFLEPSWGERNNPELEENVENLLALFRRKMWTIAHVRHDSRERNSPLRRGLGGFAFLPCAAPKRGEEVFTKRVHGAFFGTGLEAFLRDRGARQLVLAGLTTDHCVSTTMRTAFDLGFLPFLAGDAAATFPRRLPRGTWAPAERVHEMALASLDGEFGVVSSVARLRAAVTVD